MNPLFNDYWPFYDITTTCRDYYLKLDITKDIYI